MKCFRCLPRASLVLVLAAGLVSVSGCTKSVPQNSVSGKVSYKGGPVPLGKVRFFQGETNLVGEGPIGPGGSYGVANVPTGEVTICVQLDLPMGEPQGMMKMSPMMQDMMNGKMSKGMPDMKPPGEGDSGPPPEMMKMQPPMMPARRIGGSNDDQPQFNPMAGLALNPEIQKVIDRINKKYGDFHTTDLTYDIQPGDQQHDITLNP